jgi:transcriptional regulator with XRE-family HTH domain
MADAAEPDFDNLGDYIRHGMAQRGLSSYRDVQRATEVWPETVRRVIHGMQTPSEETLRRFADGLGLSIIRLRELAGRSPGETTPFVPPKEFDQLDHKQRRVVLEVGFALLEASGNAPNRDVTD